jgi:DNA polymerase III alpha subunit (gram-positive type)
LGIACSLHGVFDTLGMARRLYPEWHSHRLENVAARLKIANTAEHRALSDARLVKATFLEMLEDIPTVKSIADLVRISPTRIFAHGPVFSIGAGRFSGTDDAIAERCPSR